MHGIDNRIIAIIFTTTAFFLSHPHESMAKEIMFSNTAITVDNAAKERNRKIIRSSVAIRTIFIL